MGIVLQTPVNEVYFGKTKEILEIENQLNIFRNKHMNNYVMNMNINSDKDLLKLSRMVENYFGFGCFTLQIVNIPMANGFTLPIDYRYDVAKNSKSLVKGENTFKFDKKYDYSCIVCMFSGVIFNPDFTLDEVMALLMHEIGHNFNSFINKKNAAAINLYNVVNGVSFFAKYFNNKLVKGDKENFISNIFNNLNFVRAIVDDYFKELRTNDPSDFIISLTDLISQIGSIVASGILNLESIARVVTLGTYKYKYTINMLKDKFSPFNLPANLVKIYTNYKSERTADNFATMYGYGPATITLQHKLQSQAGESSNGVMKTINNIPIISTIIHMNELPTMILLTAFDEHPEGIERAMDQIKMLKYELSKNDIDPKMRTTLLADLKACEEKIKEFTDIKKGMKDPFLARHIYNKFLTTINGDLKHILLDRGNKFDQYDQTYNKIKSKK